MRHHLTVLAMVALLSAPMVASSAAAKPKPVETGGTVIPAGSPLKHAGVTRSPEYVIAFAGRITLTGSYEITGQNDYLLAYFYPDERTIALLPEFRDEAPHGEGLFIDNGSAFARAILPRATLARLQAAGGTEVVTRGQAAIVVDQVKITVECDAAHYSARFVAVAAPPTRIAAVEPSSPNC